MGVGGEGKRVAWEQVPGLEEDIYRVGATRCEAPRKGPSYAPTVRVIREREACSQARKRGVDGGNGSKTGMGSLGKMAKRAALSLQPSRYAEYTGWI